MDQNSFITKYNTKYSIQEDNVWEVFPFLSRERRKGGWVIILNDMIKQDPYLMFLETPKCHKNTIFPYFLRRKEYIVFYFF